MKKEWFRWYRGTTENPKFKLAARNGGVTVVSVTAVWAVILEDAANFEHRGVCTKQEDFIAAALDLEDDGTVEKSLQGLESVGLISVGHGDITICNWDKFQYEQDVKDPTGADRQKKFRENKRGKLTGSDIGVTDRNGTVTAVSRPDTDTDTDKKDIRAPALVFETDWPKDYREVFWQLYPRRQDKQAAFKKLNQIRRGGTVPWEAFLAGVRRYADSVRGKDPQYTKGPHAWLNAGKWDDEIVTKSSVFYSNKMEGIL